MSNENSPSGPLHIGLWVVQVLLALAFGMAGVTKLGSTPDQLLEAGMAWAGRYPAFLATFIGLAETLGAVGLVVPAATGIQPRLTGLAAAGIALIMVLAALDHVAAGEIEALPVNAVLGGLAAFVAWGRLGPQAITARGAA